MLDQSVGLRHQTDWRGPLDGIADPIRADNQIGTLVFSQPQVFAADFLKPGEAGESVMGSSRESQLHGERSPSVGVTGSRTDRGNYIIFLNCERVHGGSM